MNFIDFIILIPIIWFAFKGFRKGLIIEIATLTGLILGIYLGIYFSDFISGYLVKWFNVNPKFTSTISFIIILIGVMILVYLLGKSIEKLVDVMALGLFNKVLGAFFGAVKMLLIICILIYIIIKIDPSQKLVSAKMRNKSLLFNPISKISEKLLPELKEFTKKIN